MTHRLTHALKPYFPQPVAWFRDKETALFADFLERWPTLEAAQRAREKTLVDFFHAHNVRYEATVQRRMAAIQSEQPLTTDTAVIGPARPLVEVLVPQLRAMSQAIRRFGEEIERLCAELVDYKLFRALPGAGPVFAARLLVAFGEQRERFPSAAALQRYAGDRTQRQQELGALALGLPTRAIEPKSPPTTRPSGLSPSSRSAFSFGAGLNVRPVTNHATSPPFKSAARPFSSSLSTGTRNPLAVRLRA